MKPILVQQNSNGTLWWVVDWKISIRAPRVRAWGLESCRHKVYTLIPADDRNGRGSRIDYAEYYTFISNCK